MPSVSVIIPNHNGQRFLREAIGSALDQKDVDVEVIVVDDGSEDDSRTIIESYTYRIRSIFQENGGACAARNVGLDLATGDFIKFLDSDDTLLPDSLNRQLQKSQELTVDRGIVYGDFMTTGGAEGEGTESYFPERVDGTIATAAEMVSKSPITASPLYPVRALREVGGFDVRMPAGQEYDLNLRLFFAGWQFVFDRAPCFVYRRHEGEGRISTKRHGEDAFQRRFDGYIRHLELARENLGDPLPEDLRRAFAGVFWDTGRFALRCAERSQAERFFERARELAGAGFIQGSQSYRIFCRLLGVNVAERLAGLKRSKY